MNFPSFSGHPNTDDIVVTHLFRQIFFNRNDQKINNAILAHGRTERVFYNLQFTERSFALSNSHRNSVENPEHDANVRIKAFNLLLKDLVEQLHWIFLLENCCEQC